MNTLRQKIIDRFRLFGADLVRFGNAERFRDPKVRLLMPEVRTVICAAFRQPAASGAELKRAPHTTSIPPTALKCWRKM